ncbi:MAG: glycosyltransferase family 2 protein [Patescibacteria group bacterium]
MQKVGIIIVNFTSYAERFLADCVASLRAQACPDFLWRFYIVDNCSAEKSRAVLKNYASEAIIVPRADGNYAAANALGIEQAMKDGCEYFVIANMDVVFAPDWLAELIKAVEPENIGIAQSKILLYDKNKINSVGNLIHFLGFGFTRGYGEEDGGQYDNIKEITGYASGCSLIIKKEVIAKIGSYDREYYMYHDDLELGFRARLAGYKIAFAPRSIVFHKYEFSRSVRMLYYMERNRYLAIFSFYKLPTIILILPPLIIMDLGMLFYSLVNGWFFTKLKVYGYFLSPRTWRHILSVRQQVKKIRLAPDKDIIQSIAGKIEYQEIMNPILRYIVNPVFNIYWNIIRSFIWW